MDVRVENDECNERTERLMFEADRLLGTAEEQEIRTFDTLMQAWEEMGLQFAERLELAVVELRSGALPHAAQPAYATLLPYQAAADTISFEAPTN